MKKAQNRGLETIAAEIHTAQRSNVITVGKLLLEAREACEHGTWLDWLANEFEMSSTQADRLMGCGALADKFPKLVGLSLSKSTLYEILKYDELEQDTVITALAKHAARKPVRPAAAKEIMNGALLAKKYGALPTETLHAINSLTEWSDVPWAEPAIQALRTEKPKTEEAANEICRAAAQLHMDGVCGKLPPLAYDALERLASVSDEDRPTIVEKIVAEPDKDWSGGDVGGLEMQVELHRRGEPGDDDPPDDAPPRPEPGLPPDLFHALHTLQDYAHRTPPKAVKEFSVQELTKIEKFVHSLREIAQLEVTETVSKSERDSWHARVKDAADRAEARSRQSASGKEGGAL